MSNVSTTPLSALADGGTGMDAPSQTSRHIFWTTVSRLKKDPRIVVSAIVIVLLILVGLFAPLIAPYDPEHMDYMSPLSDPSRDHLMGTDQLGRDLLSRLIYGARLSLQISVYSVAIAFVLGVAIGVTSSFFGSWIDALLMRVVDILLAFPALVLAITVAAYLGPSLRNIALVIGIVYTPIFARLTYVVTRSIKQIEYVHAARAIGATPFRIITRVILPNSMAPLIVQITLSLGFAILTESGLSFLGLGVPPPAPSWGSEIAAARLTLDQAPLLVVWPSITIALAILSFNVIGDALRDHLDPRIRHR
jgi:peptide/nickel transport system permease protein